MGMKGIKQGFMENEESAIEDYEISIVSTEVDVLPDGEEYLVANCPYCGYSAMIERHQLENPEAEVDGCEHLVEIEEDRFSFKRVNRLNICIKDERKDCVPPKMHPGRSIWNLKEEAKRAKLLRERACCELSRQNMKTAASEMRFARLLGLRSEQEMAEQNLEMLVGKMGIAVYIYIPKGRRVNGLGALNAHISGIIDALGAAKAQAADARFDPCFGRDRENPVYPKNPILFMDERQISGIDAGFCEIADSQKAYYEVEVTFIR